MNKLFLKLLLLLILYPIDIPSLSASEGGGSHYSLGGMASFIDFPSGIPYNEVNMMVGYFGSASPNRQFPISGLLTLNVDADSFGFMPAFQYDLPNEVLGGHYAVTLGLPIMTLDVKAAVVGPNGVAVERTDSRAGLGDIYFSPFNLFWRRGNFSYLASVGIYAPSGAYDLGRLANLGKNYWSFNPTGAINYKNVKTGLEATAFSGFSVNTKNKATDYQSGHEFFFEFTIDKRFRNGFGVGGTGAVFQQITGDSGVGAKLGSFRGRAVSLGPEFSYVTPLDKKTMFAMELKWLPELEVENRLKGNWVWLKFGFIWPMPQMPTPAIKP